MKSRSRSLLNNSIDALLAGIEVYNKPSFSHREETFTILAVNAWELLLKARILLLDGNRMSAIFEYESRKNSDGNPSKVKYRKKNRSGNPLTISLFKAYDKLTSEYSEKIDSAVRSNIEALVEIRDNAIHFMNKDINLVQKVHEIGSACIKNYLCLIRQWFGVDMSKYQIFLMPLAFVSVPSGTVEGINLNPEEKHLLNYLSKVSENNNIDSSKDFNVALRIELSIRKTKDQSAIRVVNSNSVDAIPITIDEESFRENFPLTYDTLTSRLQKKYSNFKINSQYHNLRKTLEKDPKLCAERLLDPGNPKSSKKKFYNSNIIKEFDNTYSKI